VRYTFPGLPYITDATHAPGFSDLGAQIILDNVPLGLGGQWVLKVYGKDLLNQYQKINSVDFTGLGFITNSWGRGRVVGVDLGANSDELVGAAGDAPPAKTTLFAGGK